MVSPRPFHNTLFGFDHFFHYDNRIDIKDCSRGDSSIDHSGDQTFYWVPLDFPSYPELIQGDQAGNVFQITRQFIAPGDPTPPTTVTWTFTARRLIDRDLTVERLEATQGLQDRANGIPLVQDRRTVVRAFLGVGRDQVPIQNVSGKLTGYSGNNVTRNGLAQMPGISGFGNDTESPNRWRRTFAHEIAHTYGLDHSAGNTGGRHWFDVYARTIKPPNAGGELSDIMVPALTEPEAWISPASYFSLMSNLCVGNPQTPQPGPPSQAVIDNLIVSGTVSNSVTPTARLIRCTAPRPRRPTFHQQAHLTA